jgi:cytidine deaminase
MTKQTVEVLSERAWSVRERSRLVGKTAVGCAVETDTGEVFEGCNVEHRYRSHDIHAEVNALSSMVAGSGARAVSVFVAAERDHFTPCGACLDWIFELGGPECVVYVQSHRGEAPKRYKANELMPHYPS